MEYKGVIMPHKKIQMICYTFLVFAGGVNASYAQDILDKEHVAKFYHDEMEAKQNGADQFITYRRDNYSDDFQEVIHVVRTVDGKENDVQTQRRDKKGTMQMWEHAASMMNYQSATSELLGLDVSPDGSSAKSRVQITGKFIMNWPGTRIQGHVNENMICEDVFVISPKTSRLQITKSECTADLQIDERRRVE